MTRGRVVVVGSCNLDLIVEVPRLPAPGETVRGDDAITQPGGKGANQAVAARRLGVDTVFVGAIGDDRYGATLRAALEAERVDIGDLVTTTGPSGLALIVVDEQGENQIAVASGANLRLAPAHLRGLAAHLSTSSVVLLQLEIGLETCVAAATIARGAGARVVVNVAPVADAADPTFRELLALTDVVIANEGEARSLCPDATQSEVEELADRLRPLGPSVAIVTLGAAGAVVADGDQRLAVAAHPVQAVDTTGAGDAFCGALAAGLAEGRAMADAVRRACVAGAVATTAVGAQAALPTATEVDAVAAAEVQG